MPLGLRDVENKLTADRHWEKHASLVHSVQAWRKAPDLLLHLLEGPIASGKVEL